MGTTPAQQSVINLTWLGNHEKLHKLHLYRRGDTYTNETVMICHPKDTRRNRAVLQRGLHCIVDRHSERLPRFCEPLESVNEVQADHNCEEESEEFDIWSKVIFINQGS
ncbi:uncharacterized protein [Physcomitrium patens]|uniref:uncharacterized protein isoform X1 n=1 Tax=Physcomitrium patens TaxID=3218 RepID=UPI000D17CB6F|nr:uncharacterized protein LOC112293401 isoform X1 [Physcomitrium patens]|eukprot:XP_024398501.1 uncharacterized protein LOC112293401 isoform X1 [Physcomitrella patens]